MQFDLDLETGTVKAEFSLAAFAELMSAKQAPSYPPLFVLDVASDSDSSKLYKTFIWFDAEGMHFFCPCGDHTYRKRFCKHLSYADIIRMRRADQRVPALS